MAGERTHERIELNDSWPDILVKMCEGNPGALSVLARLLTECEKVELGSPLGPLQVFLAIDSAAIYGSNIWLLWKDVCGEDMPRFIAAVRALDFGIITAARVHLEMANRGTLDHDTILAELRKRVPKFGEPKEGAA